MKIIKVRTCGVCPNNNIRLTEATVKGEWNDYCYILHKFVNPNTIDEDCELEDLKE